MQVPFSYLKRQFNDPSAYLDDIRTVVARGDFTLGVEVAEFERQFAALHNAQHAVGVGNGTDAIALALKGLGVKSGDEVITCTNTFIATVGAIVQIGATPVFVDCTADYVIDADQIEAAITPKTRAIVPVHYTGNLADMPRIQAIAEANNLLVVEDACQAILGGIGEGDLASWSDAAAFSLHPLKNLNIWGDGGMIMTRHKDLSDWLRLYRNHGLVSRDECSAFGVNCRLDTLQAAVGLRMIEQIHSITGRRREVAGTYDRLLADFPDVITIPPRRPDVRHVFHLYVVRSPHRDRLRAFLKKNGVPAKVHYPVPIHLQPAAAYLGYKAGDFPVAEEYGRTAITLPGHQHLDDEEIQYVVDTIGRFST